MAKTQEKIFRTDWGTYNSSPHSDFKHDSVSLNLCTHTHRTTFKTTEWILMKFYSGDFTKKLLSHFSYSYNWYLNNTYFTHKLP
jgi:hypothetical protein